MKASAELVFRCGRHEGQQIDDGSVVVCPAVFADIGHPLCQSILVWHRAKREAGEIGDGVLVSVAAGDITEVIN